MTEIGLVTIIVASFIIFGFSVMLYAILRPIWDRVNEKKDEEWRTITVDEHGNVDDPIPTLFNGDTLEATTTISFDGETQMDDWIITRKEDD